MTFLTFPLAEKSLYRKALFSVLFLFCGEVTERPKVLAWKAGVLQGTGGSNPPLSASFTYFKHSQGFEAERTLPVAEERTVRPRQRV